MYGDTNQSQAPAATDMTIVNMAESLKSGIQEKNTNNRQQSTNVIGGANGQQNDPYQHSISL